MRKLLLFLVLFIIPAVLSANSLQQLRQTLGKFPGNTPIRARYDVQFWSENADGDDASNEQGSISFEVDKGPGGLSIIYPEPLLAAAEREAAARRADPEKPTPIRSALSSVEILDVSESLDAAAEILRQLEGAKLVADQQSTWGGRPARLLTIVLPPRLSKSEARRVKKFDVTLKVWLDAAGVPVAAERTLKLKASFLVLSFEQNSFDRWIFALRDDHLVATRHEESSSGSGVGQTFKQRKTVSVGLK